MLAYHHTICPPSYTPPTPASLLTNPYNYVGHKGSDLAAGPKRGGGRPGLHGNFCCFCQSTTPATTTTPPFSPTAARHHFYWKCSQIGSSWAGVHGPTIVGGLKELTACMRSPLDWQKHIGRSNLKRPEVKSVILTFTKLQRFHFSI